MKKFNKELLFLGAFLLATACSEREWSKEEKDKIYDRCREEGGSRSYCNCYLQNAMEKFHDPEELEEIDFETAFELSLNCEEYSDN